MFGLSKEVFLMLDALVQELMDQLAHEPEARELAGFGTSSVTMLLPVFLMLPKTLADVADTPIFVMVLPGACLPDPVGALEGSEERRKFRQSEPTSLGEKSWK